MEQLKSGQTMWLQVRSAIFSYWRPVLCTLAAVFAVEIALLAWKWPFTHKAVVAALEHQSHRKVQIRAFRSTFAPPGYIAEDVTLLPDPNSNGPTITARKLVIVSQYFDLLFLRRRIEGAFVSGIRVSVPPASANAPSKPPQTGQHTHPRFTEIGQVRLDDAAFSFPSFEGDPEPLTFTAQSLSVDNINRSSSSPFRTSLLISDPKSVVHATGQFGPWNLDDPASSKLSGSFSVDKADLSSVGGISGLFTGGGTFSGSVKKIACTGSVDVPQFRLASSSHSAHLATNFRASVNGLNGDVTLDQVDSQLNRTLVRSQGTIKGDGKRPGKNASLLMSVDGGHIEDLLLLFGHSPKPSMTGQVSLRANVNLPPGPPEFLKKLKLDGEFDIDNGQFTKLTTQSRINDLSKSAEGMSKNQAMADPTTIFSDLRGHVVARNGTATLSQSALAAPGLHADLSGTYSLVSKTVNLEGLLRTTGKLSDTTSGWKAGLLKVITPLWKKNSVTSVPFTISGKVPNPAFSLSRVKKRRT